MKQLLLRWVCLTMLVISAGHASAQSWPTRPIKLIVPFPPGGSSDVFIRSIMPKLNELLGQPVVVDYRAGAGGAIGMDAVAKAAPDGYTIGVGSPGALVAVPHMAKVPYTVDKDFFFITGLARVPSVILTNEASGIASINDLMDRARKAPGTLNYGHAGQGTLVHLAGELFKREAKIDLTPVPFKGAAPAVQAVMGNQVHAVVLDLAAVSNLVSGGKLRPLAVTSAKRAALMPDVPTLAEVGLPNAVFEAEYGIIAPAAIPADARAKLVAAFAAAIGAPEVKDAFVKVGAVASPSTPAEYRNSVLEQYKAWGVFIREQKIVME